MITLDRAQAIVAAVEAKHKAFHSLDCAVSNGQATVRFRWIDKIDPRTISTWFDTMGALPVMTGRVLVEGEYLVDYGVIRFVEMK